MDTQEKIKDRILRRAAQLWGYTDSELETSFDPIVTLLLEACASELEKVSSELNNSRSRIIERLLEIMSPENKTGIVPAQSILHLTPIENNFTISLEHQFLCRRTIQNIYDPLSPIIKDIHFGTTLPFKLTQATLEYAAFGDTLHSLSRIIHKDLISKSTERMNPGTFWLGFKCPKEIDKIEQLMFFTDIRNISQREVFYNYLKQAKFYLNDKEIPFKEGYNVPNYNIDIESIVNKNYNKINQLYTDVNNFYYNKFFHFTEDIEITEEIFKLPEELKKFNSGKQKIEDLEDIFWIKIQFPEVVINDILENVMFYINSIPVINKRLLNKSQKIDSYINYIALETEDIFLDMEGIGDSRGYHYHIKEFSEGNLDIGDATLRHTGVVRFDERNASEVIQYLIELLKDESASFSVISGDFIHENIRKINQLIATLEQHIKERKFVKASYPYVIIRPKNVANKTDNDLLNVTYWVTTGENANDLKIGTRLTGINTNDFQQNSIMLINTSVGGKSRLNTQEKITSYREALLTRGRVVTFADIKTFCLNHFKHSISDVEIKKGTKVDSSTNKGFVRTIDILVSKNEKMDLEISEFEWQYLCDNFLHKLDYVSSNVYPYRLFVK